MANINKSSNRPFLGPNSPLTKPALCVISINIEGFSQDKAVILSELSRKTNCDVLCVQETHRDSTQSRPHIPGLSLVAEICHPKHGNAVFVAPGVSVISTKCCDDNNIEIITVDLGNCTVTSVYKPPGTPFQLDTPDLSQCAKIVVGDFNSHSTIWGYSSTNSDGHTVEEWADANDLTLIHDPKQPASFNSGRWKRGYNPDLIFVSSSISTQSKKTICPPIPRTQHRPIMCNIQSAVHPVVMPFKRRFNYLKADWEQFSKSVDAELFNIPPTPQNYDKFVSVISVVSRKCIPRGCRTSYIPGISEESGELLKRYENLYDNDPFSEETVETGEKLLTLIGERRQEKWVETVTNIDMTHNSKKAWTTIRKLTSEPPAPHTPNTVTANQVAHQLLLNGKPPKRLGRIPKISNTPSSCETVCDPFQLTDIVLAIQRLSSGKASGVDHISVEQIKHLGPVSVSWLLQLFNHCLESAIIPRLWRRSKVIAIPKPAKPHDDPKNFRPISLLCHTYKLFERLLLTRLTTLVDPKLIPEQAGFRPGKSCCSQVLNLTQHIEDGFETRKVTGAVFVDLSAAYDTVNIKRLLWKVTDLTEDLKFTRILRELLSNRRFQVNLLEDSSRWRTQKNGLPQGSVLAPLLFNIYTNDQPVSPNTTRFLYADDLALTCQATNFEEIEATLSAALSDLSHYYAENALKPNPSKTQSCAFHLRNRQAGYKLNISWQGVPIAHSSHPKYLGITLDRSLTYKNNCRNVKLKVHARNHLLRRLTSTKWGASPKVLRTTGMALCFSAGEYACPVWDRSAHAHLVDTALNETCRIITGCLKPTPVRMLYPLSGIAPPKVRRIIASRIERTKLQADSRHPMHSYLPVPPRLKSRKSFLGCVGPTNSANFNASTARCNLWRERFKPPDNFNDPSENLPPGHALPWPTWKSLNRLRTQVGRTKDNLYRWGFIDGSDLKCVCGVSPQTMAHLPSCTACPIICALDDLLTASVSGVRVAEFWAKHNI